MCASNAFKVAGGSTVFIAGSLIHLRETGDGVQISTIP
jgi:hypothetical protein